MKSDFDSTTSFVTWKWKLLSCVQLCDPMEWLYSPCSSPGQNTGVGSLSLLQGIIPTQGLNPGVLHCRWILYQLSHKGSPRILEWVAYPFSSRSFWPKNWTGVSCIAGGFFTNWAIRKAQLCDLGQSIKQRQSIEQDHYVWVGLDPSPQLLCLWEEDDKIYLKFVQRIKWCTSLNINWAYIIFEHGAKQGIYIHELRHVSCLSETLMCLENADT